MKALIALVVALFAFPAFGAAKTITGNAWYKASTVVGYPKWTGKPSAVSGQLGADGKAVIWADLTKLKTGDGLRDEHMHGYLDTKKYPKAKLQLDGVKDQDGVQELTGSLTLKTETKPVKVRLEVKGASYTAKFTVHLSDFKGIIRPEHGGIVVRDEIEVEVTGTAGA